MEGFQMEIKRDRYLNQLISKRHNSLIKIITGSRKTGKSYLLFHLYKQYLLEDGVESSHIIEIALDDKKNKDKRDPDQCIDYVYDQMKDEDMYYLFIDEIQFLQEFEDVMSTFLHMKHLDVYITGSQMFLSSDIITEFIESGDEIHVYPLSFYEFFQFHDGCTWDDAYTTFCLYGGFPYVSLLEKDEDKEIYLKRLFSQTYMKNVLERNKIKDGIQLETLIDVIASSIGFLINPRRLSNTFKSIANLKISEPTIKQYLQYLEEASLVEKVMRYDIKAKRYIRTPYKYYFSDLGLRNARLNFCLKEETHIMENIIFNELRCRGYSVDVGVCELLEKKDESYTRKQTEVNFVANRDSKRYYIQAVYALHVEAIKAQEECSLFQIDDHFKKIIVVKDNVPVTRDNNGITIIGLKDFLLDQNSLDL